MRTNSTGSVLGLWGRDAPGCTAPALIQRLLALVSPAAEQAGAPAGLGDVRAELERLRDAGAPRPDGGCSHDVTQPLFLLCERWLEDILRSSGASRELAAAITLVREAVATIAGEEKVLQDSLAASADRIGALRDEPDVRQLKAGLAREVRRLKDLSATRELQWRRQMTSVERRVETLEHELAESRLEAAHDTLTGLANRRSLEHAFGKVQSVRRNLVLALFDFDDLKAVNDTFGHLAGDEALKMVAATLQKSVREHDVVGRFGGDEFVVLMLDLTLTQAEQRLPTLVRQIRERGAQRGGAAGPHPTVSCGASEYAAGDTFESLLDRADQALYEAKRAGKNRLAVRSAPFIRDLKRR